MSGAASSGAAAPERGKGMRSRQPKQLLLAFFGEHVVDQDVPPLRASALIEVLEGAGVAAPATRATLDRMVQRGLLTRERRGREILFSLTERGRRGAARGDRARARAAPFDPHGTGWTLVTFTVPEDQRTLRHRLRSALTWEGFAPLRDGLWLAPGEVDLAAALEPLRADLPAAAITAFHARELPGYAMADNVRAAWDIEGIRDEHLAFIATWSDPSTGVGGGQPALCPGDARRRLARAARGRPAASARVHGRRLAGRPLVRGLLGRSGCAGGGIHRAVRGARRRRGAATGVVMPALSRRRSVRTMLPYRAASLARNASRYVREFASSIGSAGSSWTCASASAAASGPRSAEYISM